MTEGEAVKLSEVVFKYNKSIIHIRQRKTSSLGQRKAALLLDFEGSQRDTDAASVTTGRGRTDLHRNRLRRFTQLAPP